MSKVIDHNVTFFSCIVYAGLQKLHLTLEPQAQTDKQKTLVLNTIQILNVQGMKEVCLNHQRSAVAHS